MALGRCRGRELGIAAALAFSAPTYAQVAPCPSAPVSYQGRLEDDARLRAALDAVPRELPKAMRAVARLTGLDTQDLPVFVRLEDQSADPLDLRHPDPWTSKRARSDWCVGPPGGGVVIVLSTEWLVSGGMDLRTELLHEGVHAAHRRALGAQAYLDVPGWVREGVAIRVAGQQGEWAYGAWNQGLKTDSDYFGYHLVQAWAPGAALRDALRGPIPSTEGLLARATASAEAEVQALEDRADAGWLGQARVRPVSGEELRAWVREARAPFIGPLAVRASRQLAAEGEQDAAAALASEVVARCEGCVGLRDDLLALALGPTATCDELESWLSDFTWSGLRAEVLDRWAGACR